MGGFKQLQDIQQIGDGGELEANEESVVANLTSLSTSGAGEFIRKTGAETFENATPSGATGTLSIVKSNDVQVGDSDIATLDFSSDFSVAESPDTEVQIELANKTGADTDLVTGTAGTNGDLAQWNADGDLVDGPTPPSGAILGTTDVQTVTNKDLTDTTNSFTAASDTQPGVSELATAAETTTGTDDTRAVTPDGLSGSDYGKRIIGIQIVESDTAVTVADGKVGIPITAELNGYNIVGAQANVYTKGITGTTDVQIRRQRGATDTDVLSTKITIGDEYFAADGVINAANDDLATGDMIFVDVDAVHSGTAPNGLSVVVIAQLP